MQRAGEVIFGRGVSDGTDGYEAGTPTQGLYIPEEIASHKVTIVAKDGKRSIRYADGSRPVQGVVAGQRRRFRVPRNEKNWIDTGAPRAELPLRAAWLCLKFEGEYVSFGGTKEDQAINWIYSEVNPMEQAAKPARGRPRNDSMQQDATA